MDLQDWFSFNGKIDKGEYIKRFLVTVLGSLVLGWIPVAGWILFLVLCVAFMAACIRRLRGLGKNPWLSLLTFIPLVGLIFAIWLAFTD